MGRRCTVGNVTVPHELPPRGQLVFDADFESGNLGRIDPIGRCEYDLFIRPDTCNGKYRVWFHFSVENALEKQRVVFNIVNFSKPRSLFDTGNAAPVVRLATQTQWRRIPPKHLYYYRSAMHGERQVLSFAYVFGGGGGDGESGGARETGEEARPLTEEATAVTERVFFAYSIPYTYTQLRAHLAQISARRLPYFRRDVLCETLQQREVDLLTIEEESAAAALLTRRATPRRVVCITARVHPGESPASIVLHGLLEFLVSDDVRAAKLRAEYCFKIVPMLNPDGVALGNYRCHLLGADLNRQWHRPSAWMHPTIHATRNLLLQYNSNPQMDVVLYLDVHAHSQKTNSFLYGNSGAGSGGGAVGDFKKKNRHLWLPACLSRLADDFSLAYTAFNQDAEKEGTGRRAMGGLLPCQCFTLEVSFFSYRPTTFGGGGESARPIPYLRFKYESLGEHLVVAILHYLEALNDERRISVVQAFAAAGALRPPPSSGKPKERRISS